MQRSLLVAVCLIGACNRSGGKSSAAAATCGLAALAGPTALLGQFGVAGQTLTSPPRRLPERLVVRLVAGPAHPAIVGRSDSMLVIGMNGALPPNVKPGFGVLIMDQGAKARGVLLFEGAPVEGAPEIGTVAVDSSTVPLIGIQVDPAKFEDPRCPLFPDSVIQ
ncbi:MAG: hypothetical protein ACJ8BF_09985 [Gemmatimonadales bacterium]